MAARMRMPDAEGLVVTWTGWVARDMTGQICHPAGDVIALTAEPHADGTLYLKGNPPQDHWRGALAADRKTFRIACRGGFVFLGTVSFDKGRFLMTATRTIIPEALRLPGEEGDA